MFKKTLIQLTLINAALLILMLALLGGTIYFYEKSITFRNSDTILKNATPARVFVMRGPSRMPGAVDPGMHDPRLVGAIMDKNNNPLVSSFGNLLSDDETKQFFKPLMTSANDKIIEKKAHGSYYHVLSRTLELNSGSFTVIYGIDVSPEMNLLHTLLSIILYGLAIGAALSLVAGYYLARRALRPIQNAWDKQNRFVADASHELRTPLSILQLKIEGLLKQPRRRIQDTGEDIAVMLDETRRLSKLVGNLLTLARSDANRLEVSLKPLDLVSVLEKVSEPFSEMAELEEKSFSLKKDSASIMILADEQRIHQLLVILLDNAMKFTPKGGRIIVTCDKENRMARLSVSDSGLGIAEADLPHVFDRFFQADTSRTGQKGTGLGLSIAEWIANKHSGKIEVSSTLHKGTTFTVHLPLVKKENETKRLTSGDSLHQYKIEGEDTDDKS
ncbi:sensor histidine kinase [Sporolactobacillus pectinivorans]|uniref:sensor histidine kinase n=1 Tax=Sporolactobacillus pectinivorans TaxID=1591408 RepID=UPI000C25B921|nr:HAMP domain-containing sensor histidine kinase [Sporolactobacillus pectinivorans]